MPPTKTTKSTKNRTPKAAQPTPTPVTKPAPASAPLPPPAPTTAAPPSQKQGGGAKPKLVNRGPAGLLTKVTDEQKKGLTPAPIPEKAEATKAQAKHKIAPALKGMTVKIDKLVPDPENARLHPERNLGAIQDSLRLYGQVKPVVVRKSTNVIVAGNGTVEAAKALGWVEVAAVFVDMTDVEAAGYGLADNRTAELAKWDFEVVARLDKLLLAAGHESVGWSADELEVLRAADWTPPPIEEGGFGQGGGEDAPEPLMVSFTPDQYDVVGTCIKLVRQYEGKGQKELDQAEGVVAVCRGWLAMQPEEELAKLRGESQPTETVDDDGFGAYTDQEEGS